MLSTSWALAALWFLGQMIGYPSNPEIEGRFESDAMEGFQLTTILLERSQIGHRGAPSKLPCWKKEIGLLA